MRTLRLILAGLLLAGLAAGAIGYRTLPRVPGLGRSERLAGAEAGTRQQLERARTQVAELEAQIAANRAQQQDVGLVMRADAGRQRAGVAVLRARARDAHVISPMDGVVLARHV